MLSDKVNTERDLYSGLWSAPVNRQVESDGWVAVVGTTGNVDLVRPDLQRMYPFNLCVVPAEFSRSDLDLAEFRLAAGAQAMRWSPMSSAPVDRVVLRLLVLDDVASQHLDADAGKVELDPLVVKSGG